MTITEHEKVTEYYPFAKYENSIALDRASKKINWDDAPLGGVSIKEAKKFAYCLLMAIETA